MNPQTPYPEPNLGTPPSPGVPGTPLPPQGIPQGAPQGIPQSVPQATPQMQTPQIPQTQMPQIPQMPQTLEPPQPGLISTTETQNQQILQQQQAQLQQQSQQPQQANPDLPTSTQSTLLISELRDSLVIMKDGSFRAVVACQSINFDLMSENERDGVEINYQDFLNSLTFTTQILLRSQRVDIGPYIDQLVEIRRNNDNMLLGVLMDDYINFIDALSQEANIMDKSFFIIIPYYTNADNEKLMEQTKSIFKSFSKQKTPVATKIDRETYDKAITEINNRVESVIAGLFRCGIHSVRLNTRELASLYYNFNNPDTAVREPLVDFNQLATTYVRKGEE